MNEAIGQLVDWLKTASPIVWQAAYRQVYIDGFENILLAIFFIIVSVLFWRLATHARKNDWGDLGVRLSYGAFGVAALIAIPCLIEAIDCFGNPTFQAIKYLASLKK